MAYERSIRRYRYWYAKLLHLYSKPHYERFGEGMEQTFTDILRERSVAEKGLFGCAFWMFAETSAGIIREDILFMIMQNKTVVGLLLAPVLLLLVPLVAMQFTDEVNWTLSDIIVMGVLLYGAVLAYLLLAKKSANATYRTAIGLAIVVVVAWLWAELAVGVFTTWGS